VQKPAIPTAVKAPYKLPLSNDQFKRAISRGHGRTWLHIKKHGSEGLNDVLRYALLYNLAYDQQVEGSRVGWMEGILDEAGVGDALYTAFIEQVHEAPNGDYDYWHISQRASILGRLAKRGMPGARAALDRLFHDNRAEYPRDIPGAYEIMYVDGEKGLLQVASALGREAYENGEVSVEDGFLLEFDEYHEAGTGIKILEAARESDPWIDRFLTIREADLAEFERATEYRRQQQPDPKVTTPIQIHDKYPRACLGSPVEEITKWIQAAPQQGTQEPDSLESPFWLWGWGRTASDAALEEILQALEVTESPIAICRYLSIFSQRAMPYVSDKVIGLAESTDVIVRSRAYAALKNVSDPRIRAVALRSLTPGLMKTGSLELFQSNYTPSDLQAIEQALFLPDDVHELHAILSDVMKLCTHIKQADCLTLMLFVYEYAPCGHCRQKVFDTMVELGIAPEWIIEESRFDAMESIREKSG